MEFLNHNHIAAILLAAVVTLGMSSCNNSENDSMVFTDTATVSIPISGTSFGDDVATRSVATASETVSSAIDLGGGIIMETSIMPENSSVQSRAANTIISGTVLVAIYDGSTLYRTIPNATISNGVISNIEVPIGKPIKLVFYANYDNAAQICTAPTVSGETITSDDAAGSGIIDLMRGEISSVTVTDNTTTLDGFTFRHLYSRAKVTYTINFGNIDSPISSRIKKETFSSGATVALSGGSVTTLATNPNNDYDYGFTATNSTNSITSGYKYFIANESSTSISLSAISQGDVNEELGKSLLNTITLNSHFTNGISYNVVIALNMKAYKINFDVNATDATAGSTTSQAKGWNTNVSLKTTANPTRPGYVLVGWTLDKTKTSEADIIASGSSVSDAKLGKSAYSADPVTLYAVWAKKYDTTTYAYSNSSAYSGCPSETEAEKYVGAGIYWDSSALWSDMSGNVSRGGVWLMKAANIPSGTASAGSGNATAGTPINTDNYFFLPSLDGGQVNCWLNDGSSLLVNSSDYSILIVFPLMNADQNLIIWGAQ